METLNIWSMTYSFFSFVAGFVSLSIAIYLSPHWKNISARLLMLLMVSVAVWTLACGMEFISPTLMLKLYWVKIEYLGSVWLGVLIFSFMLTISKKKWQLNKTGYFLLSIVPVLIIFLVITNDNHHLMWSKVWLEIGANAPVLVYIRKFGFWFFVAYSYTLTFLATVILIQSLITSRGLFRKHLLIILIGIASPWIPNVFYVLGVENLKYIDLTPAAFTISGIAFSWGLLRYQMLNLIPVTHETVIESMGDPVITLDMNDRILDVNKAAQVLLKIKKVLPAHETLKEKFPLLFEYLVKYRRDPRVETETSFVFEAFAKYWNYRVFPLLNRNEKHFGWVIILRDITDRKRAENALKESERIQRIMLGATPNPVVYYNETGEVTYINPAFTKVFGWHIGELLGKKIDFVPKENLSETQEAIQKTFDQPDCNNDFITKRYTKSGEILDVSVISALYRAKDGSPSSMVVNLTDITQIKKTERELRNAKNYIRSIVNSMPSILIGLNAQGIVTQWNTEAARLTGIRADQAEERSLKEAFPQLSTNISNIEQIIAEQKVRKETKITLPIDGKTILTDITIYPILSDNFYGVVIRIDDISERVRIEEMMIQSEKMLSLGGLAAGMAHEINNPLAGIIQNTQVIQNRLSKDLPANTKASEECGINLEDLKTYMEKRNVFSLLDSLKSSGQRAAQIVSNMLSFSRKSDRRKSTHHLHEIMESTIDLAKNDYSMKKQYDFCSIEIIREYQEGVRPILCEMSEIQQVFLNILKNGAEAMAEEKISSPLFIIRYFRNMDQVVFEIEDNGPGIDWETRKRIFEPFFTTKDVGSGTGLGLSVSYFIITENHRGVLAVESTPGKGTTFIIKLPING
ncbi:MAG: PAS domain S-box protein [Desulfobacteraceae bacterium]|nr:PAS domain S-box protein [Desulfobacteraceae bacterium]